LLGTLPAVRPAPLPLNWAAVTDPVALIAAALTVPAKVGDDAIEITGFVPPEDEIGDVPVTEVTAPLPD